MERKTSLNGLNRKVSAITSAITDLPSLFFTSEDSSPSYLAVPSSTVNPSYHGAGDRVGDKSAAQSRRSSYCGRRYSRRVDKKSVQAAKQKERQDWLKKYTPLSSTNLLSHTRPSTIDTKPGNIAAGKSVGSALLDISSNPETIRGAIDPNSDTAYRWLMVISIVVVYYLWVVILKMTITATGSNTATGVTANTTTTIGSMTSNFVRKSIPIFFNMFCNALFACDMYIQLHTAYLDNGILETDTKRIFRRYKKAGKFYFDVLALIPFDLLLDIGLHNLPFLLLLKLFKLYRLREFQTATENRSHYPNAYRFAFLLHNILLIIHWNACIYYFISKMIGFGTDQWVYPTMGNDTASMSLFNTDSSLHSYVYCFYWSTLTLTTIGGHPNPVTLVEYIFMTLDYLVGILMFATLVGNIGGIIEKMRKNRAKFQGKLDSVKSYMKTMDVPASLQGRVIKWFDYLWTHGHPIDNNTAVTNLPDKLKAEINLHVHFETLKKVDIFDHCDQSFLWELVLKLQFQVYSPGDYVCRKGDVGREMYIVSCGKLEVVGEGGEVLRVLRNGDYFGEISVLNIGGSQRRRTASVRAVGYSDLLCLSQNDIFDVLYDYPEAMQILQNKGREKLAKTSALHFDEVASDIASLYETEFSDIQEDISDSSIDDLPATQGDVKQMTDQLLDLQIKLYEIEDMLKNLVLETRQKEMLRKTINLNDKRFSVASMDSCSENNIPLAVDHIQVVLNQPETDGVPHRRSSSVH